MPPESIINYHETNFTDDPGRIKVIVRRKCKGAEKVLDTSKSATSVMFACSAAGTLLPVYVVYKSEHIWSTWRENGPPGARYNRSHSGWFDSNLFEDWFTNIILPYCRSLPPGPKVLLGDNLASHISLKVITECENNNIRFTLLPPNSTHLTQPLDVSVFRPIKRAWREILGDWKKHNKGVVRKDVFPRLLNQAIKKLDMTNKQNIISGFEATGLVPLNKHKILDKLPKALQENAEQADDMANSLKEVFQRARFNNTDRSYARKKKMNVEPGRSIGENDLPVTSKSSEETTRKDKEKHNQDDYAKDNSEKENDTINENIPAFSTSGKKSAKRKRNKKHDWSDSYSENDIDEVTLNMDTDFDNDLKTFSDLETERSFNDSENDGSIINVADRNWSEKLTVDDYVLVKMLTEKNNVKHYVAKILKVQDGQTYVCKFLRHSNKIPGVFVYPQVDDISTIENADIVKQFLEVEKLRRGRIKIPSLINKNLF